MGSGQDVGGGAQTLARVCIGAGSKRNLREPFRVDTRVVSILRGLRSFIKKQASAGVSKRTPGLLPDVPSAVRWLCGTASIASVFLDPEGPLSLFAAMLPRWPTRLKLRLVHRTTSHTCRPASRLRKDASEIRLFGGSRYHQSAFLVRVGSPTAMEAVQAAREATVRRPKSQG